MSGKPGHIYLVPHNSVEHWTLTVVDPDQETVYFLNPQKRKLTDPKWKDVCSDSIKIYNAQKGGVRRRKKSVSLKPLMGVPKQSDDKSCGYFVMRHMKDIVDNNLNFCAKLENQRSGVVYPHADFDKVRHECASHVVLFPES